jgi:U4/U6 small nuclear ribonucleoprotein PRP3
MLRRIDWTQKAEPRGADALADEPDDDGDEDKGAPGAGGGDKPNACHLVWEGVVKDSAFKEFSKKEAADAAAARAVLERAGLAHYWDAAAAFDPNAAPLPSALM